MLFVLIFSLVSHSKSPSKKYRFDFKSDQQFLGKDKTNNSSFSSRLSDDDANFLSGAFRICVQFSQTINSRLLMCFTVMLLRRRAVVIIGHVGSSDDEMTVRPGETMRSHIILVLLKDNSSAWN